METYQDIMKTITIRGKEMTISQAKKRRDELSRVYQFGDWLTKEERKKRYDELEEIRKALMK